MAEKSESFDLYPESESKYLEFKSKVSTKSGFKGIAKECVAFANASGGSILLGIEDKSGRILGISTQDADDILEKAAEAVFTLTVPPIQVLTRKREVGLKTLVEITVPRGLSQIYRLKSEARSENPSSGVYLRVGRSSLPITPGPQYDALCAEKERRPFDERPILFDLAALECFDNSELKAAFGSHLSTTTLLANKVLMPAPLDPDALRPTLAALIAFGKQPQDAQPEALIRISHMRGDSGRDIIMTRDVTGPMRQMVNDAIQLVGAWTEANFKLVGASLTGSAPIPEAALREAVVNAIIHRKYDYAAPVKIALFSNRLEIFSPGDLPPPLLPENLGDGSSQLRNVLLVKFARRLRLVESLGSGIALMRQEMQIRGLHPPEFDNEGDYVKVVLRFEKKQQASIHPLGVLRELLKHKTVLTAADLMEHGVPARTASRTLRRAVEEGSLEKIGERKGARYIVRKRSQHFEEQ